MITVTDVRYLTPLIIVAIAPVIIMLTLTISRNFKAMYWFSMFMFIAAFLSIFIVLPEIPHSIKPLLIIDQYGLLFSGLILIVGILITNLSFLYLKNHVEAKEEYFIILFVATFGSLVLVTANHFITFFLGLETLSISLYIMISYLKYRDYSVEAGVKFLVIASVSTAFLLFGMALVYAQTGSMSFSAIAPALFTADLSPLMVIGTGMMVVGIGFKLALVPFHMWAPDIYQGAPAPVTAFIATISKGAIWAIALRFFIELRIYQYRSVVILLSVIAILSMFTGNLLALRQTNFKRLLAYSSIAHMGYIMITPLAGTTEGMQAAVFYLITYIITSLGAFAVVSLLSVYDKDAEDINNLKGLFKRNPWLAIVLSVTMFSLAGIPLTAGFIAKFYVVLAGVRSGLWIPVFSLIINTVISLYYYLRVIKTMFTDSDNQPVISIPLSGHLILAFVIIIILTLGVLPSYLTEVLGEYGKVF